MRTLRGRAFVYLALAIVAGLVATVVTGIILTKSDIEKRTLEDLEHQADIVEAALKAPKGISPDLLAERLARGNVFLSPPGSSAAEEITESSGRALVDGEEVVFVRREIKRGPFLVSRPADFGNSRLARIALFLVIAGAGGGALALIVAAVVSRGIGKPVREVTERAAAMSAEKRGPAGLDEVSRLRASIERMGDQLREARSAEQLFMTSAAKELRAPLREIRRHASTIEDGTGDRDEAARRIDEEADHLERMVGDLIDLSRLETGRIELQRKPVDLVEVARSTMKRFGVIASERGVVVNIESAGHNWVLADHDRLARSASNLLENAIRVSEPGATVTIATEPGVFRVMDEGPGLSDEDLDKAFDRFYLYERSGLGTRDGSGLTLAVVKEFTEAMGGSVSAHQRVGGGATFAIKLPTYPEDRDAQ